MRASKLWTAISVLCFTTGATAQFSAARPFTGPSLTVAPTSSGSFLMGTDSCAGAHTNAGVGDVFGVPFTTGTTGTQGQNEFLCYLFGSTSVERDVWFDWTATVTGYATMSTCGATIIDTKVAAYPFSASSCPADGTALGCSDDTCGTQTSMTWSVTSGTSYTLQLGTSPGAPAGSGSFQVTQYAPPTCGEYDDGSTENALGLTSGGEMAWLHSVQCPGDVSGIDTAYGSPGAPSPPDGNGSRIALWEDPDCDGNPTTGPLSLLELVNAVTVNSGTDIINYYPFAAEVPVPSGCMFAGASADHAAGEFPGPMDQTHPIPEAWVVGSTLGPGTMDFSNLNNNNIPPVQMQAIGFPTAFVAKAGDCQRACLACAQNPGDIRNCMICTTPPCNGLGPGNAICFGTAGCPCGNNGNSGEGCANSTGMGAILTGTGLASLSNDTLELITTQIPNTPGLTFQANTVLGSPPTFGDGLRCCGTSVVRLITVVAQGNCASTNQPSGCGTQVGGVGGPISQHPGNASLQAGDSRCYQHWYRDPVGGPCGAGFNLSNGYVVTWTP